MRGMGTRRKYKVIQNGRNKISQSGKREMTFNKQWIFVECLFCARHSYRTPLKEKKKRGRDENSEWERKMAVEEEGWRNWETGWQGVALGLLFTLLTEILLLYWGGILVTQRRGCSCCSQTLWTPSPSVYQWRKSFWWNSAASYSEMCLNSSWIAVLLLVKVTAIFSNKAGCHRHCWGSIPPNSCYPCFAHWASALPPPSRTSAHGIQQPWWGMGLGEVTGSHNVIGIKYLLGEFGYSEGQVLLASMAS